MKTILLAALSFILIIGTLTAQNADIKWLEEQTLGSEVYEMSEVIYDGTDFYTAVVFAESVHLDFSRDMLIRIKGNGVIENKEPLGKNSDDKQTYLLDILKQENEIYGYYTTSKGANVYRDLIDKSTLKFAGQEELLLKGSDSPIDMFQPIWEKEERMNHYFGGEGTLDFINSPDLGYHVIVKRNSYAGKDAPELKAVVINSQQKTVNEVNLTLSSTNTNTQLYDVVVDETGGLYFITGNYEEKIPVITIHYQPTGNGKMNKTTIPSKVYIHDLIGSYFPGGIILTGFRSEDQKTKKLAHFVMHFDKASEKIISDETLSEYIYDDEDHLYLLSNHESYLPMAEEFTDSHLVTTGSGRSRMSSRMSFGVNAHLFGSNDVKMWSKEIENWVVAPGEGLIYDAIYPFVYNNEYYIIQNTHPETPSLSAKGEKIKGATYGKDRFATELIKFNKDSNPDREFIYLREEKFVTIPVHSRHYGDGKFLMYADKVSIGDHIKFGILDIKE